MSAHWFLLLPPIRLYPIVRLLQVGLHWLPNNEVFLIILILDRTIWDLDIDWALSGLSFEDFVAHVADGLRDGAVVHADVLEDIIELFVTEQIGIHGVDGLHGGIKAGIVALEEVEAGVIGLAHTV